MKKNSLPIESCPCHSGLSYASCCQPYHEEHRWPNTAEQLMRSRYSAYAKALYSYLLKSIHPHGSVYPSDLSQWKKEIVEFIQNSEFIGLTIDKVESSEDRARILFTAYLRQHGKNTQFSESSLFEKYQGRWLYKEGVHVR